MPSGGRFDYPMEVLETATLEVTPEGLCGCSTPPVQLIAMDYHSIVKLALGLVLAPPLLGLNSLGLPSALVSAGAQTEPSYPTQTTFDFEDDTLRPSEEGFQAIYVDSVGNALGTFVTVPGARLKVYASGVVEIDQRDYTAEITYFDDGRLRRLGNTRFTYYNSGRIRTIDNIRFSYFASSGRLQRIDNVDFSYFASSGRLQRIDNVSFDYERSGVIRRISANQTHGGIRIVVVN